MHITFKAEGSDDCFDLVDSKILSPFKHTLPIGTYTVHVYRTSLQFMKTADYYNMN